MTNSSSEHADRRLGVGLLVLMLVFLAAVVALALAQSAGSGSDSGSHGAGKGGGRPSTGQVEASQLESFALLRTAPEGLPLPVMKALGRPVHGMRWELAQRLPLQLQGCFWLVPGKGYLCLVAQWKAPSAGRFCAETGYVLAHGLAAVFVKAPGAPWFGTPGKRLIVGVAPDNAAKLLVHDPNETSAIPVSTAGIFKLSDSMAGPPRETTAIPR